MKLSKNSFLDIFSHLTTKIPESLKLYFSGRRRRKAAIYTARTGEKTFFRLSLRTCCFPAAQGAKTPLCAAGCIWRKFVVSASVF